MYEKGHNDMNTAVSENKSNNASRNNEFSCRKQKKASDLENYPPKMTYKII